MKPASGERHGRAILTEGKVRRMRSLYNTGEISLRDLMREFKCAYGTAYAVVHGLTWKDIGTPVTRRSPIASFDPDAD